MKVTVFQYSVLTLDKTEITLNLIPSLERFSKRLDSLGINVNDINSVNVVRAWEWCQDTDKTWPLVNFKPYAIDMDGYDTGNYDDDYSNLDGDIRS